MFTNLSGLGFLWKGIKQRFDVMQAAMKDVVPDAIPRIVQKDDSQRLLTLTQKDKVDKVAKLAELKQEVIKKKNIIIPYIGYARGTTNTFAKDKYNILLEQEQDIENQQKLLEEYKVEKDPYLDGIVRGGSILRWQDQ